MFPLQKAKIRCTAFVVCFLCFSFGLAKAEESFVTLWAGGFGPTTNALRTATLTLRTNETAHLASWPQMELRYSSLTISSGVNSVTLERKPVYEVDEKARRAKENGALPLQPVIVAGPAILKLSALPGKEAFCTFRIVQGPSRTIPSPDE